MIPNDSLQNVGKVGKMMPDDSLQNVGTVGKVGEKLKRNDAQSFSPTINM